MFLAPKSMAVQPLRGLPPSSRCLPGITDLSAHMPIANDDIFLGRKSLQTHWTAHMQLVGADAYLRAEAILKPVRKTCRGIYHNGARIHFAQEAPRPPEILGDDRIGATKYISIGEMLNTFQRP